MTYIEGLYSRTKPVHRVVLVEREIDTEGTAFDNNTHLHSGDPLDVQCMPRR
jgi:hypothetical protein